ncbi:hypothetical protein ACDX78_21325 [Virgibacillus oceani]
MKIKIRILLLFLMLLVAVSCSNNTSDKTTAVTIQLDDTEENFSYIIEIIPEEQPQYIDFDASYPSANAFVYNNDGLNLELETDLEYAINIYHSETEIPPDYAGDLAEYMDENVSTVYNAFNEENNELIIDL